MKPARILRSAGLLVAGFSVLAVALAGCANSGTGAQPGKHAGMVAGAQTAAQADAEYHAEAKTLPALPPGVRFPAPRILDHDSNGVLETYGPGFGNQIADSTWECLWMKTVLSDTPNRSSYDSDLSKLAHYKKTYIYEHQSVARQQFDPAYQAAKLGNTGPLSTDFTANCSQ